MAIFNLYMGLPGCGKTYLAYKAAKPYDVVIDSDEIRAEEYGDASCQDNPAQIFNIMYQRTRAALKANRDVFYVATNISMKRRMNLVKSLRQKFPDVEYRCVCVIAPLDVCHTRNSVRARSVPTYVIEKMARQFDPPCESEGWDEIEIKHNYVNDGVLMLDGDEFTYRAYYAQLVDEFGSQKNSHHQLSLSEHCRKCGNWLYNYFLNEPIAIGAHEVEIMWAGDLHDCGKALTQTYWDKDDRKEAHYPNHAEIGSYLTLVMGFKLHTAQLVRFHMVPYMDEAAQKTWRIRMGEELWKEVQLLHQADEAAH